MPRPLPWDELGLDPVHPSQVTDKQLIFDPDSVLIEPKMDGYRGLLMKRGKRVRFVSKSRKPLFGFDDLETILGREVSAEEVIIDGEIVSLDEFGRSSLINVRDRKSPLQYMAFDVVRLDGRVLKNLPLSERKKILGTLIPPKSTIQYMPPLTGPLLEIVVNDDEHEGLVLKDLNSPYIEGPGPGNWYKIKRKLSPEQRRKRQSLFSRRRDE